MTPYDPVPSIPPGADHRGHARKAVLMAGRLLCDELWQPCEVVNVSMGGAKLRVLGVFAPGQRLSLEIHPCGQFPGVVAWVRGEEIGLQFLVDSSEMAETLIGLATYG